LIANSSAFFAHIDRVDCFGTFAEIGFAAAFGKPIFITFAENLGYASIVDMWFLTAYKSVKTVWVVSNNSFIDPALVGILGSERERILRNTAGIYQVNDPLESGGLSEYLERRSIERFRAKVS
jgi:nucleoside 2-deoxyribosyltransferase